MYLKLLKSQFCTIALLSLDSLFHLVNNNEQTKFNSEFINLVSQNQLYFVTMRKRQTVNALKYSNSKLKRIKSSVNFIESPWNVVWIDENKFLSQWKLPTTLFVNTVLQRIYSCATSFIWKVKINFNWN